MDEQLRNVCAHCKYAPEMQKYAKYIEKFQIYNGSPTLSPWLEAI